MDTSNIYERVKEICAERGTTVKALEEELGLGNGTIRSWATSSPSVRLLRLVADKFSVSLDYLVGRF